MSLDYILREGWSCEISDLKLLFSQNFVLSVIFIISFIS